MAEREFKVKKNNVKEGIVVVKQSPLFFYIFDYWTQSQGSMNLALICLAAEMRKERIRVKSGEKPRHGFCPHCSKTCNSVQILKICKRVATGVRKKRSFWSWCVKSVSLNLAFLRTFNFLLLIEIAKRRKRLSHSVVQSS